ncbi:MocR-like pyridoxine biosynthesis transcription factor PdxR [Gracilibacillus alcaliphilus]|uniref:MocR-like pyridoxine biosynthesis transcription factor PdxR n=1 Tax=Gracilibacillus alcaliphilus TaxID=1401441 RepID=UPI001956F78E|nr:PLP-dependent aminotransferase family protein [Gracilibacillus alcaliphilus]MBM7675129.1 DNA-binding transcriptional MocR family regulator [Gracilibacillus alcaliphilus]
MKIELSRDNSNMSLVDQIFFGISERIDSSLLQRGTILPSVRKLAADLGVSIVTVHKAYKRLAKEGYIHIYKGKGAFISDRHKNTLSKYEKKTELSPFHWQQTIDDYIHRAQLVQYLQFSNPIQFATSVIYPKLLPTSLLAETMKSLVDKDPSILVRYCETQGDPELRNEMKKFLNKVYQLQIPIENIMITSGVQQGIDLVARSFIGPGDVVIMEQPCFTGAIDVMRSRGATILTAPVKQDGICLQTIEELCDRIKPKIIYTNPTFQNPTGTVMSEQNRQILIEIAEKYDILIIEDDAVGDLYFNNTTPPKPIKYWDRNGHVVYLKGFSKPLSPGCRIAALAASGIVFERLVAAKATTDICSPLLTQKAVLSFLQSDKMSPHLEKLRIALEVRRDRLHTYFSTHLEQLITYRQPMGGLNFWIELPCKYNAEQLLYQAVEHNILFLPGSACFAKNPRRNFIRLSFSSVSDKDLDEGAERFANLLRNSIK